MKAAVPAYAEVKTGTQAAADQTKQLSDAIGMFLKPMLLSFGGIAVFVGAFIIFNAFSMTVAQRRREFAMLRALGATRRQVLVDASPWRPWRWACWPPCWASSPASASRQA